MERRTIEDNLDNLLATLEWVAWRRGITRPPPPREPDVTWDADGPVSPPQWFRDRPDG